MLVLQRYQNMIGDMELRFLRDNVTIGGGKGVSWELEMKAWRNSSGEVSA